jgi:hypothetical protein
MLAALGILSSKAATKMYSQVAAEGDAKIGEKHIRPVAISIYLRRRSLL